ncbi:unnamed protein product [Toxocara canis]|uniref:Endo/exonuclease/phosphatase domain-containing protein n=1 Tax=Toxocara canis TaxID=6265 RepID=A0A183URW0_TOXCA|nr:unnamed protein product [Toxocara canis]
MSYTHRLCERSERLQTVETDTSSDAEEQQRRRSAVFIDVPESRDLPHLRHERDAESEAEILDKPNVDGVPVDVYRMGVFNPTKRHPIKSTYCVFRCDRVLTNKKGGRGVAILVRLGLSVTCDRILTRKEGGGGVAILVRLGLSVTFSESMPFSSECEVLYIDFACEKMFRLIVAYRPSYCTSSETEEFFDFLAHLSMANMPCIIVGDFNACSNENGVIHLSSSLEAFIRQCGVQQLVNGATRQDNMLDLVLTNDLTLVNEALVGGNFSTSDHASLLLEVMVKPPVSSPQIYRDFKGGDWATANAMLSSIDWNTYFLECSDIEEMYAHFIKLLNIVIDCIPIAKVERTTPSLPNYLQQMAAKKHFLWLDRLNPVREFENCDNIVVVNAEDDHFLPSAPTRPPRCAPI